MNRQVALFMTAVQFLTRLPTPQFEAFEPAWLARSARYFPLVGVLVGAINVGVWWLASQRLPAPVAVGLMLAVSVLVTGAFHEDGFADVCDGFGGGATADRVLAIMKDSRVGAFGAIGIVLLLGLKWATLDALAVGTAVFAPLVIGAHLASRWCAGALMWSLPYVRTGGDSKARAAVEGFTAREWLIGGIIGLAAFAPVAAAGVRATGILETWALMTGALSAAATAVIAAGYFRRRIGGHTGDCLGAVQQLTELAFLIGGLAAIHPASERIKEIAWRSI
ncbi:MAG: adenosylcobinamide-GDP ribazoletransferase [Steroidobacteraceae bacterium]